MVHIPKKNYPKNKAHTKAKEYDVNGSPLTIPDACDKLDLDYNTIYQRIRKGVPPEIAMTHKTLPEEWSLKNGIASNRPGRTQAGKSPKLSNK